MLQRTSVLVNTAVHYTRLHEHAIRGFGAITNLPKRKPNHEVSNLIAKLGNRTRRRLSRASGLQARADLFF